MTDTGDTPDSAIKAAAPDPVSTTARVDRRKVDGRWVAAAGMGIGSAALVAALLYANRNERGPKPTK